MGKPIKRFTSADATQGRPKQPLARVAFSGRVDLQKLEHEEPWILQGRPTIKSLKVESTCSFTREEVLRRLFTLLGSPILEDPLKHHAPPCLLREITISNISGWSDTMFKEFLRGLERLNFSKLMLANIGTFLPTNRSTEVIECLAAKAPILQRFHFTDNFIDARCSRFVNALKSFLLNGLQELVLRNCSVLGADQLRIMIFNHSHKCWLRRLEGISLQDVMPLKHQPLTHKGGVTGGEIVDKSWSNEELLAHANCINRSDWEELGKTYPAFVESTDFSVIVDDEATSIENKKQKVVRPLDQRVVFYWKQWQADYFYLYEIIDLLVTRRKELTNYRPVVRVWNALNRRPDLQRCFCYAELIARYGAYVCIRYIDEEEFQKLTETHCKTASQFNSSCCQHCTDASAPSPTQATATFSPSHNSVMSESDGTYLPSLGVVQSGEIQHTQNKNKSKCLDNSGLKLRQQLSFCSGNSLSAASQFSDTQHNKLGITSEIAITKNCSTVDPEQYPQKLELLASGYDAPPMTIRHRRKRETAFIAQAECKPVLSLQKGKKSSTTKAQGAKLLSSQQRKLLVSDTSVSSLDLLPVWQVEPLGCAASMGIPSSTTKSQDCITMSSRLPVEKTAISKNRNAFEIGSWVQFDLPYNDWMRPSSRVKRTAVGIVLDYCFAPNKSFGQVIDNINAKPLPCSSGAVHGEENGMPANEADVFEFGNGSMQRNLLGYVIVCPFSTSDYVEAFLFSWNGDAVEDKPETLNALHQRVRPALLCSAEPKVAGGMLKFYIPANCVTPFVFDKGSKAWSTTALRVADTIYRRRLAQGAAPRQDPTLSRAFAIDNQFFKHSLSAYVLPPFHGIVLNDWKHFGGNVGAPDPMGSGLCREVLAELLSIKAEAHSAAAKAAETSDLSAASSLLHSCTSPTILHPRQLWCGFGQIDDKKPSFASLKKNVNTMPKFTSTACDDSDDVLALKTNVEPMASEVFECLPLSGQMNLRSATPSNETQSSKKPEYSALPLEDTAGLLGTSALSATHRNSFIEPESGIRMEDNNSVEILPILKASSPLPQSYCNERTKETEQDESDVPPVESIKEANFRLYDIPVPLSKMQELFQPLNRRDCRRVRRQAQVEKKVERYPSRSNAFPTASDFSSSESEASLDTDDELVEAFLEVYPKIVNKVFFQETLSDCLPYTKADPSHAKFLPGEKLFSTESPNSTPDPSLLEQFPNELAWNDSKSGGDTNAQSDCRINMFDDNTKAPVLFHRLTRQRLVSDYVKRSSLTHRTEHDNLNSTCTVLELLAKQLGEEVSQQTEENSLASKKCSNTTCSSRSVSRYSDEPQANFEMKTVLRMILELGQRAGVMDFRTSTPSASRGPPPPKELVNFVLSCQQLWLKEISSCIKDHTDDLAASSDAMRLEDKVQATQRFFLSPEFATCMLDNSVEPDSPHIWLLSECQKFRNIPTGFSSALARYRVSPPNLLSTLSPARSGEPGASSSVSAADSSASMNTLHSSDAASSSAVPAANFAASVRNVTTSEGDTTCCAISSSSQTAKQEVRKRKLNALAFRPSAKKYQPNSGCLDQQLSVLQRLTVVDPDARKQYAELNSRRAFAEAWIYNTTQPTRSNRQASQSRSTPQKKRNSRTVLPKSAVKATGPTSLPPDTHINIPNSSIERCVGVGDATKNAGERFKSLKKRQNNGKRSVSFGGVTNIEEVPVKKPRVQSVCETQLGVSHPLTETLGRKVPGVSMARKAPSQLFPRADCATLFPNAEAEENALFLQETLFAKIHDTLCGKEQETIPGHKMPRSVLLSLFQRLAATVPKNSETFAFSREDLMERLKAILTKTLTLRSHSPVTSAAVSALSRDGLYSADTSSSSSSPAVRTGTLDERECFNEQSLSSNDAGLPDHHPVFIPRC